MYDKKATKKYKETEKGKLANRKTNQKYYYNHLNKIKAQYKLKDLFKSGNISNDEFICAICSKQSIEKHHENYELPFVFIPLCKKHHSEIGGLE